MDVNLALRILDDQLIDVDGRRFGRIDDLELDGGPGRGLRVSALIVGAGAWRWRVPGRLAGVVGAVTPNVIRRIPWELVSDVEPGVVRVARTMGELGFGTAGPVGARWIDDMERETLRVSTLLGAEVRGDGAGGGRVHDLRARLDGPAPEITGVLVGRAGWRQRLEGTVADAGLVEWSRVERLEGRTLVLSA